MPKSLKAPSTPFLPSFPTEASAANLTHLFQVAEGMSMSNWETEQILLIVITHSFLIWTQWPWISQPSITELLLMGLGEIQIRKTHVLLIISLGSNYNARQHVTRAVTAGSRGQLDSNYVDKEKSAGLWRLSSVYTCEYKRKWHFRQRKELVQRHGDIRVCCKEMEPGE